MFRDTIQSYKKAAQYRLQDAQELRMPPTHDAERSDAGRRHLRGAMYLAGYAVECLLKAYIIQQQNSQTLSQATARINEQRAGQNQDSIDNIAKTAAGHKLVYLLTLTDLVTYPGYDTKLLGRVAKWQSSWRYESDIVSVEHSQEFIDDVEQLVNWLQPKK